MFAAAVAAELPEARLDPDAPATPRELDAEERLADRSCGRGFAYVPIGLGRFCANRPVEGAVLVGLAAGEATLFGLGGEHPYSGLGVIGLTNVVFTSIGRDVHDGWLAHHRPYTPPETLGELVAAPFRPAVLKRPGVWIATTAWTAAAVTTVIALEAHYNGLDAGGDPNLFGWSAPPALGYPLGGAVLGTEMLHVAVGEEVLFRGVLQSALSRAIGPTPGLVTTALIFTSAHLGNWLIASSEYDVTALIVGPLFVGTGALVTGGLYQGYGYRLSHGVAAHFWYDFALQLTGFVLYPETSTLSARITLPLGPGQRR